MIDGFAETLKGKLVSVSGDNLSSHVLAGFQTYFQSGRICRTCMADYTDIGDCLNESDFQIRDATS